ncbi:ParB/RepB/Spo0J family partition protein [Nocardia thailandica]
MTTPGSTDKKLQKPGFQSRLTGRPGGTGLRPKAYEADISGAQHGETVPPAGGLVKALASIADRAAAEGVSITQLPVNRLAPHPHNDPERSAPQPDSPQWKVLLKSVQEQGVQIPCLVVTRAAFVEAHPNLASALTADSEYVIIYGHRRCAAAAQASVELVPAIIDDSILVGSGDLDRMTMENWGREDLNPIALARQFATYSAELGLAQRSIGERLGVDQATVSRHMRLLFLVPEAQEAVRARELSMNVAVEIATDLPWGPPRSWQKSVDPEQNTEERAETQRKVLALVSEQGMTPTRAVSRIVAESSARATAAAAGIKVIADPAEHFGPDPQTHRIADPALAEADTLVAAIDPDTGNLAYYSVVAPDREAGEAAEGADDSAGGKAHGNPRRSNGEAKVRAESQRLRRLAVAKVASRGAGRDKLGSWLIEQFRFRIRATDNSRAWKLAFDWATANDGLDAPTVEAWQAELEHGVDPKARNRAVWAVSLAAAELRASDKGHAWDAGERAYLTLLADEGYTPTEWESAQLHATGSAE